MVKELELLKIVVPDEFMTGGIIAKFPPSWRDFSTTLDEFMTGLRRPKEGSAMTRLTIQKILEDYGVLPKA
jgi:hypothetical protein